MNSHTTRSFREASWALPADVRRRARRAYRLWRENPQLPGLRFKRVGDHVSVRIGRDYRALGILEGDTVYWYWIGKHYEIPGQIGEASGSLEALQRGNHRVGLQGSCAWCV